jgi:Fic family protein
MGTYATQFWRPTYAGVDVPRRTREGGPFTAYVPEKLAGLSLALTGPTSGDVSDAEQAIASLNSRSRSLRNSEIMARLLLRAEAVASSHIEGLQVPPSRLLRAEVRAQDGLPSTDVTASEVLGNVNALACAESQSGPLSTQVILEVHRRLLAGTRSAQHAGILRVEQNWIGGTDYGPFGARFVPPPPEYVPDLLEDLWRFCNDDTLPPLVQAAIAHAQFETIHPFADGNGRAGRALIAMILCRRGVALNALPPISLILATRSEEYIARLQATRTPPTASPADVTNALDEWIAFFAVCTKRACSDALDFESRVDTLVTDYRQRLGQMRSDASEYLLLDILPEMPILTINSAAARIGRSYKSTNAAITTLEAHGILRQANLGLRNRAFEAPELIGAFADLERRLASPSGDTYIEPPRRPVPRKRNAKADAS